jgi:hypothetical protein
MPVKSAKQYRFMQMMAHNPGKANKKGKKGGAGPSPEVAHEMIMKTAKSDRSKFAKAK